MGVQTGYLNVNYQTSIAACTYGDMTGPTVQPGVVAQHSVDGNPVVKIYTGGSVQFFGTANQLVFGTTKTITVHAPPPAANVVYTVPDVGGAAQFVMTMNGSTLYSGGGGVTSVFGRTGVVVAVSGDYAFSQISGTASLAQLPTAIPNSKLANSSVTVTAGTGMTGGGAVALGSAITLTNGGVLQFNSRTGNVTPTTGDYSFSQISGAVALGQLPTGIPNANLANSSVTVTAGTGMSGGGAVSLGGTVTLTNGGVVSFKGRTGAVTSTTGDYTAAQVTNAVDQTGSYADPAWITSLASSKVTAVVVKAGVPYTATTADHVILCDATATTVTVTLPAASNKGTTLTIMKIDTSANLATASAGAGDTVNGSASHSVSSRYSSITIVADGSHEWYIIAST